MSASRCFFLLGALPLLFLGVVHAAMTPHTTARDQGLSPRDPSVRQAMERDTILLTRRTSVWLAWVGFNLSHSLGVLILGAVVLLCGRSRASFEAQACVFIPFALLVSVSYLVLAVRYWFKAPAVWMSFASACFLISWVLFATAG